MTYTLIWVVAFGLMNITLLIGLFKFVEEKLLSIENKIDKNNTRIKMLVNYIYGKRIK